MIRRQLNNHWLLITQPDHAHLAGEIARHWGNKEFARPAPGDEVLLAIAEHDNGWRELDAAPELNPANGLPYHFSERPLVDHFAVWRRAETRFLEQSRYASLLISRHGSTLFRYLVDTEADPLLAHPFFARKTWRSQGSQMSEEEQQQVWEFVRERELFQEKLRNQLPGEPSLAPTLRTENFNFRLLQACDALSLYACLGQIGEKRLENIARHHWSDRVTLALRPVGETGAVIEPYPFAVSPLELQVRCRKLAGGPFRDAMELEAAWRASTQETIRFVFLSR